MAPRRPTRSARPWRVVLPAVALATAVVALGMGAPAGARAGPVVVRLRSQGPASLPQGETFSFSALVRNRSAHQVVVGLETQLQDLASGQVVTASRSSVTLPPNGRLTVPGSLVTSQWFAEQGAFQIQVLVDGRPASDLLGFAVTAPTVDVPAFQDVTATAGLSTYIAQSQCGDYASGAAWGDVEGDGDLDLYVPSPVGAAQLWINDGTGRFTDEAAIRGADNPGSQGAGAVFADYDNDGDQDLYVANHGTNRLYRNDGTGHFTDVASAAGVNTESADVSASWGDYDNDGYLDLYVTSNSPCLPPLFYQQDRLYHNEGDGTFTDQTASLPSASTFGAGYQAAWFDYEHDGDQDLYLANDWWGPDRDANHLWRNDGPGVRGAWTFTDVSAASGTGFIMNSMGIAIADVDHDLDLDLAISNIGGNVLARNNGDGTFTNVADALHVARPVQSGDMESVTWGLAFADFNLDGWEDLYLAAGDTDDDPPQPQEVFTADGADGGFLDLSALSGADPVVSGRGVALADYDGDGLVDVYMVARRGSPILFRNVTATSSHWLEVDLTGTSSNRDGCGALLTLTAGGVRQVREEFCGSVGLSSGSDPRVHFGLGAATTVSKLLIEWPSGRRQVLRSIGADRLVTVVEPA